MKKQILFMLLSFVLGILISSVFHNSERDLNASESSIARDIAVSNPSLSETNNRSPNSLSTIGSTQLEAIDSSNDTIKLQQMRIAELESKLSLLKPAQTNSDRPQEDSQVERELLIGELLELSASKDLIESSFDNIGEMMGKDLNKEQKEKLQEIMRDIFSWDKLEPAFYSIYSETFTANELYEINNFYKSEIGQIFVQKTPELQAKTITTIQKTMQDSMPKLQEELEKIQKSKGKTH